MNSKRKDNIEEPASLAARRDAQWLRVRQDEYLALGYELAAMRRRGDCDIAKAAAVSQAMADIRAEIVPVLRAHTRIVAALKGRRS
jgi:hypothetical protein